MRQQSTTMITPAAHGMCPVKLYSPLDSILKALLSYFVCVWNTMKIMFTYIVTVILFEARTFSTSSTHSLGDGGYESYIMWRTSQSSNFRLHRPYTRNLLGVCPIPGTFVVRITDRQVLTRWEPRSGAVYKQVAHSLLLLPSPPLAMNITVFANMTNTGVSASACQEQATPKDLVEKRRRNMLAARRSRKRKLLYLKWLQRQIEDMRGEVEEWKTRVQTYEEAMNKQGLVPLE